MERMTKANKRFLGRRVSSPAAFSVVGLLAALLTGVSLPAQPPQPHPPAAIYAPGDSNNEWVADGAAWVRLAKGVLRLKPCGAAIVRVTAVETGTIPDLGNPVMADAACASAPFTVKSTAQRYEVDTAELHVSVDRYSGAVIFEDASGNRLLSEEEWPYPRRLRPAVVGGEATHEAAVWFSLTPEEHLYGLGQHQNGLLDQRNLEMELSQDNTNISIPFFLSSKGYGVLWNNTSATRWNNRFQPVLAVQSEMAEAVDYYFLRGPGFDRIIGGYRQLTGAAPLFPRWAYGFWQCKLAYASQEELLGVAAKYRALRIPLDNIILDMGWETVLGSRQFTGKYPDPAAMVKTLHDEHVNLMVSVWPLFVQGSANYDELLRRNFFVGGGTDPLPAYLPGSRLYDAFNPEARRLYWRQIETTLHAIGADAYWMDSTEPGDLYSEAHGSMLDGTTTALGNGSRFANIYPLMTSEAVYKGQRGVTDRKRVFILTRSAYAGMQRNAAAAWSGDIATNFATLRREIPAGLNYSMTGLPYWTTDIGGFVGGDTGDPAYRELFVRWFQYGSFCPVFRAHGARKNNQNELWSFGDEAQKILTLYDRLRYRLLPYTYSLAARTTFEGYTPMRALAFDFREDEQALTIGDEFLYGPALLAAPVTEAGAAARSVYLPKSDGWYDFWSGEKLAGGQRVTRAAPLSVMPLYVRAGTILPLGEEVEYSGAQAGRPIELRLYPGADAEFTLYDDDGLSYDYEKGSSSSIALRWDDKARRLSFGARQGTFASMPAELVFHVVLVSPAHGAGEEPGTADRSVTYNGSAQQMQF
jgi:alpha-D-xyloside xylohydrolase